MKTIVIRPEIIGFDNTALREPRKPVNKLALTCAIIVPLVGIGGWVAGRVTSAAKPASASLALAQSKRVLPAKADPLLAVDGVELQVALDQKAVAAEISGNGRERADLTLTNRHGAALVVKVSFGQVLESSRNAVVVVRPTQIELPPGKSVTLGLQTAALRSANVVATAPYRIVPRSVPKLDLLLTYVQDHAELSTAAIQTAVLALTENLPVRAICRFTTGGADLPSRFDTAAFRVETLDIIAALTVLREIGVKDKDLALTIDPLLKAEAMIEPLCRANAMRYYRITAAEEWAYWKQELLQGDDNTRHYALFGIARFYPEVALEMLPKWAREKRTTQLFRLAAVQALGNTQRPEAVSLLRQLVNELGRNTELGRAAMSAADYLDDELAKATGASPNVAFRGGSDVAQF